MNITEAMEALEARQHITREGSNYINTEYFLSDHDGKRYLFMRTNSPRFGIAESPAVFDWDDMASTDWRVVTDD